jgi:hypothetical protein
MGIQKAVLDSVLRKLESGALIYHGIILFIHVKILHKSLSQKIIERAKPILLKEISCKASKMHFLTCS